MSCTECFKAEGTLRFPINSTLNDESAFYRRRKEDESRFLTARNGDWFSVPFQCEGRWFHNLFGKEAKPTVQGDHYLMALMRRANLDMFWSREKSTVLSQFSRVKGIIRRDSGWNHRSIHLFPTLKAHPLKDDAGMGLAMKMLEKSRDKGRNAEYTQFDTVRQLRSVLSNIYTGSAEVRVENGVLKSRKGEVQHLHDDPMQSTFMERFMVGMQNRMPVDSNRDTPLLGHVVAAMLGCMKGEVKHSNTPAKRRRLLIMVGGYVCVTYAYSLRGNEGFWVDGDRLVKSIALEKYSQQDIFL